MIYLIQFSWNTDSAKEEFYSDEKVHSEEDSEVQESANEEMKPDEDEEEQENWSEEINCRKVVDFSEEVRIDVNTETYNLV